MADSRRARRGALRNGVLLALCAAAASFGCRDVRARAPDLHIDQPRASIFPNGGGAAYLTIVNRGGADQLQSAEAAWAQAVALHEVVRDGDVVSMHELPAGLPIPANSSLVLEPGGRHLMLQGVSLDAGVSVAPLTLHFARAGDLRAQLSIESSHF